MRIRDSFNVASLDPLSADRDHMAYAMWLRAKFEDEEKARTKKDHDDLVNVAMVLATEDVLRAFEKAFEEAMAFYAEAFERLEELEGRITAKIHDIESNTVTLTDKNGQTVYQDDTGAFYTLSQGKTTPITDEDEIKDLKSQVQDIQSQGRRARTVKDQEELAGQTVLLSDVHDLRVDLGGAQSQTVQINSDVQNDPSLADVGAGRIRVLQSDMDDRVKALEERNLDRSNQRTNAHQLQSEDQLGSATVISSRLDAMLSAPK